MGRSELSINTQLHRPDFSNNDEQRFDFKRRLPNKNNVIPAIARAAQTGVQRKAAVCRVPPPGGPGLAELATGTSPTHSESRCSERPIHEQPPEAVHPAGAS